MVEWIARGNGVLNGIVWGPFGLALLFCTGLWMTVRTGGFQFRKAGYWMRHTIGAVFTNREVTAHTGKEDMAISQFQSMCTALAGTIGTGNIVGVATAIVSGGPGAIFWMWVMALLGMMTSFSENVLGVYYRRKNEKGEWSGGAMYYLTDGLGAKKGCKQLGKVLAVLFACFCILASFGIGNMSQLNSIAGNMNAAFGVPTIVTGLALMVVTALIVIGGLKRVAAVTEKLVPLMALFYIAGALIIVVMHAGNIPAAFGAIFKGAFNLQAAGGGALGYGISQTITWGFKRGAFSNEAGLGSAVMVNSASNVKEPVHQGMWGVFEVFADTIVVCTLTALVILTTGVVDLQSGAVLANVQDNALVGQAFTAAFGSFGPKFIAISILLFAYSTTLGWSHYGTKAVEYLFGTTGSRIYKVVFVGMTVVGSTMKLGLAWDLSDTFNGLMMIPNLIGVLALSGTVVAITKNYLDRRVKGLDIEPMWSAFEEYQKQEEAEAAAEEKTPEDKKAKKKKSKETEALEQCEAEKKELEDRYLRLMAEYDNYRRRTQKERDNIYPDAVADTLKELLPLLDNLQRALETPCTDESYITGIRMIQTGFEEYLKRMGVEAFGKAGDPFDPNLHNAVMHIEDESLEKNVVAQVFQSGYRRGDRILRHAMVQQAN